VQGETWNLPGSTRKQILFLLSCRQRSENGTYLCRPLAGSWSSGEIAGLLLIERRIKLNIRRGGVFFVDEIAGFFGAVFAAIQV